ncbi:hypothetical protein LXT21_21540 [Myxococcus sp. K38C18041901]|uniref:hypothetical protein n=1 Tax=Myxococcus guangdongensis TaxID=2906760 RepID=UPI0020A7C3B7|nr:hypothetical protein [Myxococcus guangdongensis]MCP3061369.1 hypothetical protein [Myxococcus guangdongensis]
MNRIAPAVLSGLLALLAPVACTSPAKTSPSSTTPADTAKLSAPVDVGAKVSDTTATVSLRFQVPGEDVRVEVSGADGLQVTSSPSPVTGVSVEKSALTNLDVAFTPGAGRSHLVVTVSGIFQGVPLTKVASFAVGQPTEQQKAQGSVVTDDQGQRIKMMPSSDSK